jgi:DNA-binding NarL/FixJ family response regulator
MIAHKQKTTPPGAAHVQASWPTAGPTGVSDVSVQAPRLLRVLIVDDSEMDREWIGTQARTMEGFHAALCLARSLAETKAIIATQRFDVALVDYRLGPVYGDDVIRLLNHVDPMCATVLVSSHAMAEVSLYGLKAGATAALSKDDINPTLLETTIRFALANRARLR